MIVREVLPYIAVLVAALLVLTGESRCPVSHWMPDQCLPRTRSGVRHDGD